MSDLHVVILAAGKGTRMKSERPKVLHKVAGLPMIERVFAAVSASGAQSTTVVVGHQAGAVQAALSGHSGLTFVVQEPQLGTAHALLTAEPALKGTTGTLVLLSADVPLLSVQTLLTLTDHHRATHAAATVVTTFIEQPHGYGRIVRSGGRIARIVEETDADPAEQTIREINSGIYAFELDGLFDAIRGIAPDNVQHEYYLPDLVALYSATGRTLETITVADPNEIRGINSRAELAEVSRIVKQEKNRELMTAGVTIEDPATTYIGRDVSVGTDTIIHPGVSLEGKDHDRRRLRDPQRGTDHRFADRPMRDRLQPLCHHGDDGWGRCGGGSLRAPAQLRGRARACAGWQLCRVEEDGARQGARNRCISPISAIRQLAKAST